jgi:glyceraldehyde-3-phosphate dehydrogenase/erythrose-4-phosphate dehydrogenase
MSWYDNEWGYAKQMVRTVLQIAAARETGVSEAVTP